MVKEKTQTETTTEEFTWVEYQQPEFSGLVNNKTKEIITINEAIRRILCYAEESAKNTR